MQITAPNPIIAAQALSRPLRGVPCGHSGMKCEFFEAKTTHKGWFDAWSAIHNQSLKRSDRSDSVEPLPTKNMGQA